MISLSDYVDSLRREITPPGSSEFATVPDDDLAGYLTDAFWDARLDGFLGTFSADVDGVVTPDIGREGIALVILYAGIKIIRNKLLSTNTRLTAKAGPVEFTTENSANLLVEMLKELSAVKSRLLLLQLSYGSVTMIDAFSTRSWSPSSYGGYLDNYFTGALGSGVF